MFNSMALMHIWERAWPIISVLGACSILSFAIILERWVSLSSAAFNREALINKLRRFVEENRLEQAIDYCETVRKPIGRVLRSFFETVRLNRSMGRDRYERLGNRLIRAEALRLGRYMTVLGTIGSITPFVGLFGTVVGIIHAFKAISENSGGGPGIVAAGIAEALFVTALGLFVAIPAVVGYNMYTRKIEQISENMQLAFEEIVDWLNPRT